MHRRDLLLQLSATGLIAGLPGGSLRVAALPSGGTPFVLLTDQAYRLRDALWILRIPPNTFLPQSWHVSLRVRSIRAVLGAANAVLLMESLRDLRAAVHVMHRTGDVELICATLPAARQALHARA